MIINKVAFGNENEAFIENRFKNKLNIIYSNDNNKGKTLLMQGLMYSLGYESIFPSGFDSKAYVFYSSISFNEKKYEFLRKNNSVIVKSKDLFHICNSISELKFLFDKEIYKLPRIIKNGIEKIADLTLFHELYFLGQDKRNSSNIISKGLYNKVDFKNLLFSMKGIDSFDGEKYDLSNLKSEKEKLKNEEKVLRKKLTLLKASPEIAEFSTKSIDLEKFNTQKQIIFEINKSIFEFKKQRSREQNRKNKLDNLLSELNSLNRNIDTGKVKCGDCGSDKIIFSNEDFDFEVSNSFVRKQIINSIKNDISLKTDIIEELTMNINNEQNQLSKELESIPPEGKNFILFQDEIIDNSVIDNDLANVKSKIQSIDRELTLTSLNTFEKKETQKDFLTSTLELMRNYYQQIDPFGNLEFEDLFTKKDETYSGSEEQEFYFCKLIALNQSLKHPFPIIVDSFRDGELSTGKENEMLNIYGNLEKQVILTATLKDEEYEGDKYMSNSNRNVLDYSSFEDSHILNEKFKDEFSKIVSSFGSTLNQ